MPTPRYLTKTRFKLATECPTKLFYTGKDLYPNSKDFDPFLMALAKGGFQVGELAKSYHPEGIEVTAGRGQYDAAVERTNELLEHENVTIFEAAVRYGNFFIRVDILKKAGTAIEVIEVKSKSYREGESLFFGQRGNIDSKWKPYLYDIAFQKFVVELALPEYTVSAFLMLADKAAHCPTDGLNQKFRVKTGVDDRKYVELASALTSEEISPDGWVLKKVLVDNECARIFDGTDTLQRSEKSFAERAGEFAASYDRDERIASPLTSDCKKCEFRATPQEEVEGRRSGFKECFAESLRWTDDDFAQPTIFEIWKPHHTWLNRLVGEGRIKLSEVTADDLGRSRRTRSGLTQSERQWKQIEMACSGATGYFLDKSGLQEEMEGWTFPLHFIDFETASPAIPFTRGRRPYEEIAFQFSHHVVEQDGSMRHKGQHLEERIAYFPNYDLVRMLREELSDDCGTIFRYSHHENTYLNAVYRQLLEDESVGDREALMSFIRSISHSTDRMKRKGHEWEGERAMVDMCELVIRFYFDPQTKGSNSIKKVLPAILNRSQYLQQKYSTPVYGTAIPSFNFAGGKTWVEFDSDGSVRDPYDMLPPIFGSEIIDRLSDEDDLKDGGAAMMAYARLQFEDMSDAERSQIRDALLRYCELDTLAMVMLYEGWREMIG